MADDSPLPSRKGRSQWYTPDLRLHTHVWRSGWAVYIDSDPVPGALADAGEGQRARRTVETGDAPCQYDVAFSYAREDQTYVEQVAEAIEDRVRVFYDRLESVDLWGRNLYTYLADIYGRKSRYCVIFISRHYASKVWTNHEREAAQARALTSKQPYLLPARFDDTVIPGVLSTIGYVDLRSMTPEEFGEFLTKKVRALDPRLEQARKRERGVRNRPKRDVRPRPEEPRNDDPRSDRSLVLVRPPDRDRPARRGALNTALGRARVARRGEGPVAAPSPVRKRSPFIGGMATAVAALLVAAVGVRVGLGVAPVALENGPTRAHREWIDGPFEEAHREYIRPAILMGQENSAANIEYDETQRRIDWLLEKPRLWASLENALIHSENERAEGFIEQLERRKDDDPKLVASLANARAVLSLRNARQYDAGGCGPGATAAVRSTCDARRHDLIQALGILGKTLEKDPTYAPSLFNRALVLRELGLQASSAEAFEAVAGLGEPGWKEEAQAEASALRAEVARQMDLEKRRKDALKHLGEALFQAEEAKPGNVQAASEALKATQALLKDSKDTEPFLRELYWVSAGATSFQRKLLAPMAADLGAPALAARPASVTAQHAKALRDWKNLSTDQKKALVAEADRAHEDDLLVAIFAKLGSWEHELLAFEDALHRLQQRTDEPYVATLATRLLGQRQQDTSKTEDAIKTFQALVDHCDSARAPGRCAAIELRLTWANVSIERWSEGQVHGLRGLELAEAGSATRMAILDQLSQIASTQSADEPWLALAYATELFQRSEPCSDFRERGASRAAFVHLWSLNDVRGATEAMREIVTPSTNCGEVPLSLTDVKLMAVLVASRQAPPEWDDKLVEALKKLPSQSPGAADYIQYYSARADLGRNHLEGRAAMEAIALERDRQIKVGQPERYEAEVAAAKVRSYAYRDLTLDAAERGDFERAFEMVTRQLRLRPPEQCTLAITSDLGRTAVAIRDARGTFFGAYGGSSKWRWLDGRGEELVPKELQEHLKGCPQVHVLASPGVFGVTRLLKDIPWSYLVAQTYVAKPGSSDRRLVVANTNPPATLLLSDVAPWPGLRDTSIRILEHDSATLSRLMQELPVATDVEFYLHGLQRSTDAEGPYLALTPDPASNGEFRLTASVLWPLELAGAPYVYLKACRAGEAGFQNYANRSLASTFIERGARAVFAATVPIPDLGADPFFNDIRARIRSGKTPAVALAEARANSGDPQDWMSDVVALEPAPVRP